MRFTSKTFRRRLSRRKKQRRQRTRRLRMKQRGGSDFQRPLFLRPAAVVTNPLQEGDATEVGKTP